MKTQTKSIPLWYLVAMLIVTTILTLALQRQIATKNEQARHESLFEGSVPLELYPDSTGEYEIIMNNDTTRYSKVLK